MVSFVRIALSVAAFAAAVLAAENAIIAPSGGSAVVAGQPFKITWEPSNQKGDVTLTLRAGESKDLKDVETITTTSNTGSYEWIPNKNLPAGSNYAIMISQDGKTNYSPQFGVSASPPNANDAVKVQSSIVKDLASKTEEIASKISSKLASKTEEITSKISSKISSQTEEIASSITDAPSNNSTRTRLGQNSTTTDTESSESKNKTSTSTRLSNSSTTTSAEEETSTQTKTSTASKSGTRGASPTSSGGKPTTTADSTTAAAEMLRAPAALIVGAVVAGLMYLN